MTFIKNIIKHLEEQIISRQEYEVLKKEYEQLIIRFGEHYKSDYGWASSALNKNRPTFRDIEENSGLDHMRPFYRLASHNVHANPKGILFRLGIEANNKNILLAGSSNLGLIDPAQCMVMSLNLITVTLITTKTTIDYLIIGNILSQLELEIIEELIKTQNCIYQ